MSIYDNFYVVDTGHTKASAHANEFLSAKAPVCGFFAQIKRLTGFVIFA